MDESWRDGSPGINDFGFSNFTELFSLPPEFPVIDPLILSDLQVSLFGPDGTQIFMLGDLVWFLRA